MTLSQRITMLSFAAGVLALCAGLAAPAWSGEAEPVAAPAISAQTALPATDTADERIWTQIVWDAAANRLARRTYRLWDPLGDKHYDLAWDGDAASRAVDGPVTGTGTLIWREPGMPAYDETARVAVYSGQVVNGRAQGRGSYTHRTGVAYSGQWADGLMHGQGRLFLPNGDQYSGGFAFGRPDGDGVYTDATGTVYAGRFAAGERDGDGSLYPASGKPFVATWRGGVAIAETVRFLPPEEQVYPPVVWAQYETPDDVRVGVLVDRAYYAHVPDPQDPPVIYSAENQREEITIRPDEQRLLEAWRGTGSIAMTEDEEFDFESSPLAWQDGKSTPMAAGFLATANRIRPVPVIVELRNDSESPLRIVNAFLDVSESRSQPEPAVQIRMGYLGDCGAIADFKANFDIDNFGWTKAENAVLRFSFANDPAREFTKQIGTIDLTTSVDLSDELRQIGFPVDTFKAGPVKCEGGDFDACAEKIKTEVSLGPLTGHAKLHVSHMRSPVTGFLDYEWRDAAGEVHKKSSPFTVEIVLARLDYGAECGEGASPEERQLKPFDFAIDKSDYRIMVPLRDDVPPGVTGRWRIRLQAPQSSAHDFRIVFELADGRKIASRPIDFLFFKGKTPDAG